MECQKELFSLEENTHYLNCAYKAPLLKSAEKACIDALIRDRNPVKIEVDDFFKDNRIVKTYFADLIHAPSEQIAIIPSTSYGFSSVLNNIQGKVNGNVITLQDEFPSGYFSLKRWADSHKNQLIIAKPELPSNTNTIGERWNNTILDLINEQTSIVLISSVHWMNGLRFDLKKIGQKCEDVGAKFIVDGTQSVGVIDIDVMACKIHALVCATYKWLFGPYSVSLAYIHETFNGGIPLEEVWINRKNSENFAALTNYEDEYQQGAYRFNVGQTSNFTLMPILKAALKQITEWQPKNIEKYCQSLIQPLLNYLTEIGVEPENQQYFSSHLFSLKLPDSVNIDLLKENLQRNKIIISIRGSNLRISVNVFNNSEDIQALINTIKQTIQLK